jgi:tetratricopeptide (TPR) repeat protein
MGEVLGIHERVYGKDSSEYADTLSNLSVLHLTAGRYAEAERLQRQLVTTYARLEGDSSIDVAQVRANLAVTLTELERHDEAISEAETALHLLEAKLGTSHAHLPVTLAILAAARRESGQPAQARLDATRALEIATKVHGENNPRTVPALLELAYDAADERTWDVAARYLARIEPIGAASPLEAEQALLFDLLSAEVAWNSGGDRAGAQQRLRERLSTSSAAQPRLRARAQAWLADHPAAAAPPGP